MITSFYKCQYALHERSVHLQAFLHAGFLSILLQTPYSPQRNIRLFHFIYLDRKRFSFHKLIKSLLSCLHNKFKISLFFYRKSESRQGYKCIAGTAFEPRVTSKNIPIIIVLVNMKLMSCIY